MKPRTRNLPLGALAGFLVAGDATESPGCTDFRIKAADGTVIIGGTMDFEVPVLAFVGIFPRRERWSSDAPGMRKGIGSTSRYGYNENVPGVLTNAPTFDWHEINLRHFVNLKAMSARPIRVGASVLSPIGSGSGLLGIPGDWTPPYRFVRIAAMRLSP